MEQQQKDKQQESGDLFLDLLPNQPKNKQTRESFREHLSQRFKEKLDDSVERIWNLPGIIVKPGGEYLNLLLEAREQYIAGYFYSCVAMCGIVGERLVKDLLREAVYIKKDDEIIHPGSSAFDQFERVDINGIVRFLKEAQLLSPEAETAAKKLSELRNKYVHARGNEPNKDALKAIEQLHILVEDTVSIFKNLEFKDGVLVRKSRKK